VARRSVSGSATRTLVGALVTTCVLTLSAVGCGADGGNRSVTPIEDQNGDPVSWAPTAKPPASKTEPE
jgi:hypothetical protein